MISISNLCASLLHQFSSVLNPVEFFLRKSALGVRDRIEGWREQTNSYVGLKITGSWWIRNRIAIDVWLPKRSKPTLQYKKCSIVSALPPNQSNCEEQAQKRHLKQAQKSLFKWTRDTSWDKEASNWDDLAERHFQRCFQPYLSYGYSCTRGGRRCEWGWHLIPIEFFTTLMRANLEFFGGRGINHTRQSLE